MYYICSGPQPLWHQGPVVWKTIFHGLGWEGWFRMIQLHYIQCALYFCFYYISSTSHQQALDPRGWGPLLYSIKTILSCLFLYSSLGHIFSHIITFYVHALSPFQTLKAKFKIIHLCIPPMYLIIVPDTQQGYKILLNTKYNLPQRLIPQHLKIRNNTVCVGRRGMQGWGRGQPLCCSREYKIPLKKKFIWA